MIKGGRAYVCYEHQFSKNYNQLICSYSNEENLCVQFEHFFLKKMESLTLLLFCTILGAGFFKCVNLKFEKSDYSQNKLKISVSKSGKKIMYQLLKCVWIRSDRCMCLVFDALKIIAQQKSEYYIVNSEWIRLQKCEALQFESSVCKSSDETTNRHPFKQNYVLISLSYPKLRQNAHRIIIAFFGENKARSNLDDQNEACKIQWKL